MPLAREADVEEGINPALHPDKKHHKFRSKKDPRPSSEDGDLPPPDRAACTPATFCRKGWIWAVIVAGIILGTVIPLGLRDRRQASTGVPQYDFKGSKPLNTTILFDPTTGVNGSQPLSCPAMAADLPNATIRVSNPPPAVKLVGDRMVTSDGKDLNIHGVNWFGFNNGKTMVDGLDGEVETKHTWEGGDFAHIVHQLKLLGFNAVRLPFLFGDLYTQPPQDYSKPCPQKQPTAEALAARTTAPNTPKPAAAAPKLSANINPPGSQPGRCNAYLPSGVSTLARYLWVVQYFVAEGFYVLVDYHPEPGNTEPVTDSVDVFANNWLRLYTAFTCLPNWDKELQGRVFFDLMNEPDGVGLTWDASKGGRKNLGDYYLASMDAIDKAAGGKGPIYFIQGTGQEKAGVNWGDGFITDKQLVKEKELSDPNAFFAALVAKPYKNRVVLSPHLYGPSLSNNTYHVGEPQWKNYESSWGTLQKNGYCAQGEKAAACQKFPAVIGETGSNFTHPADKTYFDSLGKFMRGSPPADKYDTSRFNRWFWWVYNANTKQVGGLVGPDWHTLDWKKLSWMQGNLGLTPWYKKGGAATEAAATQAAAPAAAPAPAAAAAPK